MILKNILDTVGGTPIVKLNKVGSDLKCVFMLHGRFLANVK